MGEVNFANVIDSYYGDIKSDLGKFSGRVFWSGKDLTFVNDPMGKNIVSLVPRDMAKFLHKEDINSFTFHSLRRSSATLAADSGASPHQMMDFFGWQNPSMPQEYISTSKTAIKAMANHLQPSGISASSSAPSYPPAACSTGCAESGSVTLESDGLFVGDEYRNRIIQNNEHVIIIQQFSGTINLTSK